MIKLFLTTIVLISSFIVSSGQNFLYLGPYSGNTGLIGRFSVSGINGEISLLSRTASSFIEVPTQGDRWSIYNDGNLKFWTGTDKLILTKEGNLFLGTAVSSYLGSGRLSVSGNTAEISLNNRTISTFTDSPTQGERWSIYNEGSSNDGKLRFWSGTDKVVITKEGRVGIGTINPDRELTVKGKIHSEEIIIDLAVPAPDYVFSKEYQLTPLSELKRYVEKNKHLPEIPTAEEFQKNGIEISVLSINLLKKIEEMTLYQIDLLEKIEQMNKRILELETQVNKSTK